MAGRELEMENACVAAAARVVLSTLMQSRNSSEAALATVMKTLKGQMSRHNDAVRKLNEAAGTSDGDGAAATKVHEMLEQMRATIPRSIGLLQRKEDSSNVFFLSEVSGVAVARNLFVLDWENFFAARLDAFVPARRLAPLLGFRKPGPLSHGGYRRRGWPEPLFYFIAFFRYSVN